MTFDRCSYVEEMTALIDSALTRLHKETPKVAVFVVSIWTDPNAAASSISIETRSHSNEFTMTPEVPNDSPADFEFRDFVECRNQSFSPNWEEQSSGSCWDELEPALVEVGEIAAKRFSSATLERGAILGVNSRRDWFDRRWALG